MAILLIALFSVAALIVGTLAHLMILVWIALGLSLIGLALVTGRSVLRRWRAAKLRRVEDHDDDVVDDAVPDAVDDVPDDAVEDVVDDVVDDTVEVSDHNVDHTEAISTAGTATLVATRTEQLVRVVAGRRRYHQAGCQLLGSHSYAEITRAEAADEGFTACTKCCG